jgi:uncharacterized Zn finger protein (UPF0148 family)
MPLPPALAAKMKQHVAAGASPREALAKAIGNSRKACPKDGTPLKDGECPKCGWHAEPDEDDMGGKSDGDEDNA